MATKTTSKPSTSSKAGAKSGGTGGKSGGRCWSGYEPTPGKKPFTKGSCRKK